ncbi:MAG: glycosyltransferase, partial [Desulfobacterales bacterium]|nr:glycosyltransferase [Desulfobacterales bacterium]
MIKVLHIVHSLASGGGPRAVIALAKYSGRSGQIHHSIASLLPADPHMVKLTEDAGLSVYVPEDRNALFRMIQDTDIVHLSWWNTPEIYEFLRSELPEMRLIIWFHVGGETAPQIITKKLVDFADYALACSPYTYERPVFENLPPREKIDKTGMVYGATDFERLTGIVRKPHNGFNVGYVGTV